MNKNFYFITWVTYNSRISERMIQYKVRRSDDSVWLTLEDEIQISGIFRDIVLENDYEVYAYNICSDHVHMVLRCEGEAVSKIIAKLKGMSSLLYNSGTRPAVAEYADGTHKKLWAKKYHAVQIQTEEQLFNAIEYTKYNRQKHDLQKSEELERIIESFIKYLS